uniref:Eva-1-like protein A, regulator of programmed cell death n=1 Tax=Myotis myotis TaxID=51298 RepID=A0A7J7U4U5_MYOMY|nr:eva-1-like protein A, regulator of programmed cell death [Myotis myotis]
MRAVSLECWQQKPDYKPEKPTGANQVSGPVLLGTNVTRDELFLPEIPLFLTAHLPQKRREGGATLIPLKHLWEVPLDATWRLPFRRSTEPLTAQRMDMALLSSILATYSFISENPSRSPHLSGSWNGAENPSPTMWMEMRETGLWFLLISEDLRSCCRLHGYVLFLYKRKDVPSARARGCRVNVTQ